MTAITTPADVADVPRSTVRARPGGFFRDLASVATRALKLIPRDIESVIPALVVPLFFFVVNTGSLSKAFELSNPGESFKAFQIPVAIIFAVTGVSRASTLVTDIQDGYFDRLLMTPMNRMALLLGLMVADFALVIALSIPVVILGLVLGVHVITGPVGIVLFLLMAGMWGVVFTGFPYAIALKTGSPAAVNSSFILFFPFAFLTTSFLPKDELQGWLATVATYNPVTYLLAALRSLIMSGWDATALWQGLAAVLAVGVVSQTLAFSALRGRVRKG
jgi:ABC-2 type transport system permease protein